MRIIDYANTNTVKYYKNKSLLIRILLGFFLIVCGVITRPIMYLAFFYIILNFFLEREMEFIFSMLFAWMSFATIFKFTPNSSSLFTYIEILVVMILLIRNRKINKVFFTWWIFFSVYIIFGMGSSYTIFIKLIIIPILMYFIINNTNYLGLKTISFYFILGVISSSIVGYFKEIIPNLLSFVTDKSLTISYSGPTGYIADTRFSGLSGDPNYYTVFLILVIAVCIVFFIRNEMKVCFFYFIYSLMIFFGSITGSKSFFLMLIIVTFLLIYLLFKNKQYNRLAFFCIIIIMSTILIFTGYIDVFSKIFTRFKATDMDLTTGRTQIWFYYFHLLCNDFKILFFGNGIGAGYPGHVAHNTYLDCIIICGIVGSIILLFCIRSSISGKFKAKDTESKIPLIMLIIMYFFLSMFFQYEIVFQLALVLMFIKIPKPLKNNFSNSCLEIN